MIKKSITNKTSIRRLESREGETIGTKVRRVMSNNEPIHDEAPLIYTERKEGVNPDYDIRSDRFDFALDAMSKIEKSKQRLIPFNKTTAKILQDWVFEYRTILLQDKTESRLFINRFGKPIS